MSRLHPVKFMPLVGMVVMFVTLGGTSAYAQARINQSSFSAAETTLLAQLVTSVSKAVKRYCRREFDSQTFDELYNGTGAYRLVLDQYPVLGVSRVATGPKTVLTVKNTSGANQRATVAVTLKALPAAVV